MVEHPRNKIIFLRYAPANNKLILNLPLRVGGYALTHPGNIINYYTDNPPWSSGYTCIIEKALDIKHLFDSVVPKDWVKR
mgnify:FL=1